MHCCIGGIDREYVHQCRECGIRKALNWGIVPTQEYDGANHPFERTHMDLTGPFRRTVRENRYILVVKCS